MRRIDPSSSMTRTDAVTAGEGSFGSKVHRRRPRLVRGEGRPFATPTRRTARLDRLRRVGTTKPAHGSVELFGSFEVADVSSPGDDDELRIADRPFELACGSEERRVGKECRSRW